MLTYTKGVRLLDSNGASRSQQRKTASTKGHSVEALYDSCNTLLEMESVGIATIRGLEEAHKHARSRNAVAPEMV